MNITNYILELFGIFDLKNPLANGWDGSRMRWTLNDSHRQKNFHKSIDDIKNKELLKICNDFDTVKNIFENHCVIQMRKYKGEPTLILGCGNDPVDIYYKTEELNHQHENCYTIDHDIGMNPSIVGRFGIDDMKFLGKEIFDEIIFEGFKISCHYREGKKKRVIDTDNKCTIENILYLLKDNGNVIFRAENEEFGRLMKKNNKLHFDDKIIISSDNPKEYLLFYRIDNRF